jgi:hypothetical protein
MAALFSEIEKRWQTRFGKREIYRLRKSLWALISGIDVDLPDCLPILGYGLLSKAPDRKRMTPAGSKLEIDSSLPLPTLLSRAPVAFANEFDGESEVSLAISANVPHVLDEKGLRVRDPPNLTGASKEAIAIIGCPPEETHRGG